MKVSGHRVLNGVVGEHWVRNRQKGGSEGFCSKEKSRNGRVGLESTFLGLGHGKYFRRLKAGECLGDKR